MSYEIAPPKWKVTYSRGNATYSANGDLYDLVVFEHRGVWIWTCYAGRLTAASGECNSPEEGKQLAEAEWRRRLLPMLVEVKPETNRNSPAGDINKP